FKKQRKITDKDFFENNFYNSFCQAIETLHFLEEVKKDISVLLKQKTDAPLIKYEIKPGRGLGLLEAPRGCLFSYFEIGENKRITDCSIITPTAQFLRNLEEDLKVLLPEIKELSKDKKIRRIRTLVRAYDPCISCAVH
ncbi:MAG: nickel-dependent hydrogenase large subunit, partial [bacterium]|nr:nickel-dependent hydrogenase large subunit [bacterium]